VGSSGLNPPPACSVATPTPYGAPPGDDAAENEAEEEPDNRWS
jgi:hypothetical protein